MHVEGKSLRAIAKELGVSRMAVARAIRFVEQAESKFAVGEAPPRTEPASSNGPAALRGRNV